MIETDYQEEYLYHMTHVSNLLNIFHLGALLSQEEAVSERIIPYSIANDEVQALRSRVFVWDYSTGKLKNLHSYVPLYFAIRNSMLYRKYKDGIQEEIVILEIDYAILQKTGVVFTDGNASVQRLSDTKRNIREIVEIRPATFTSSCLRMYRPYGRPFGKRKICSEFYTDTMFLERLDWPIIYGTDFNEPEKSRKMCAEVLVPDILPLSFIKSIAVSNQIMVQKVNRLIIQCGLAESTPFATLKTSLFFFE